VIGKPRSRIPVQLLQTPRQALADLPQPCNKGTKRNAQGHFNAWVGYKRPLEVASDKERSSTPHWPSKICA
jgi:hypothetical protein